DAPSAFGSTVAREAALTEAEWISRAERSAHGPERAMFFALDDSRIVGLAGGYREAPDAHEVELISMWTAPAARRTGVGRTLVHAVIDWAVNTDATVIGLWVTGGNEPAQRLYAG